MSNKYIRYPLDYRHCKIYQAMSLAHEKGYTKLMEVLHQNENDMLRFLTKDGITRDPFLKKPKKDLYGTPKDILDLSFAAYEGDINKAALLINEGVNVNGVYKQKEGVMHASSPLSRAAERGEIEIVKLLIRAGANIDGIIDHNQYEEATIVNVISGLGYMSDSNPEREICKADISKSPLHLALSKGHYDLAAFLIQSGAKVSRVLYDLESSLQFEECNLYANAGDLVNIFNFCQKNTVLDRQFMLNWLKHILIDYKLIEAVESGIEREIKMICRSGTICMYLERALPKLKNMKIILNSAESAMEHQVDFVGSQTLEKSNSGVAAMQTDGGQDISSTAHAQSHSTIDDLAAVALGDSSNQQL